MRVCSPSMLPTLGEEVHAPDLPEGVMLPGSFLPVWWEVCPIKSGLRRALDADWDYMTRFCNEGCSVICSLELLNSRRAKVPEDRVPILLRRVLDEDSLEVAGNDIAWPYRGMNAKLLSKCVYQTDSKEIRYNG